MTELNELGRLITELLSEDEELEDSGDSYSPSSESLSDENEEITDRGGISLVTEKGFITTSRLLIQKAGQSDSGLYTCTPSNANTASVRVHILNGEHPAAMHHGHGSLTSLSHVTFFFSLILLIILRPPT
uniref:Uncharacterized protein LOC114336072 n=1 Tax=Diabrotica virgifera virgifera TaxID=50390 RepID=A0A6P7G068_DIAVI